MKLIILLILFALPCAAADTVVIIAAECRTTNNVYYWYPNASHIDFNPTNTTPRLYRLVTNTNTWETFLLTLTPSNTWTQAAGPVTVTNGVWMLQAVVLPKRS